MGAPLPDFQPGALPALEELELKLWNLESTLPAAWAERPGVLPELTALTVNIQLAAPLPQAWARGWRRLQRLSILGIGPRGINGGGIAPLADGAPDRHVPPEFDAPFRLPGEWAEGFPALTHLYLGNVANGGPFPETWAAGGFPMLQDM